MNLTPITELAEGQDIHDGKIGECPLTAVMDTLEDQCACLQASIIVSAICGYSGSRSESFNGLFYKWLDVFAWHLDIWGGATP